MDISQPPPPLFAEPVRAAGSSFGGGEGGPSSSYAPSKGEIYKASLGLTGKNPVQALGELCTRLRLPPPYFTVAVRELLVSGSRTHVYCMLSKVGGIHSTLEPAMYFQLQLYNVHR